MGLPKVRAPILRTVVTERASVRQQDRANEAMKALANLHDI